MNFDPNNPEWTAYALGEIPEPERMPFDEEVKKNPEAKRFVEEIQAFSGQLETSLMVEDSPTLSEEQKHAILESAGTASEKVVVFPWLLRAGIAAAAAAVLATVFWPGKEGKQTEVVVKLDSKKEQQVGREEMLKESREGSVVGREKMTRTVALKKQAADWSEQDQTLSRTWHAIDESGVRLEQSGEVKEEGVIALSPSPALQSANPLALNGSTVEMDDVSGGIPVDQLVAQERVASASPPPPASTRQRLQYSNQGDVRLGKSIIAGHSSVLNKPILADSPTIVGFTELHHSAPAVFGPSIERYSAIVENEYKRVEDHPLSTFSIDVDTASYANVRRFLQRGSLPPRDAVRIEEMINYFDYAYAPPAGETPFATHLEMSVCPWKPEHKLVRIGLKGKVIENEQRPSCNLVFLLDVSGSMNTPNKLPLVKKAMTALVKNLDERDRIAIVVYAGASGLVLDSTSCEDPQVIVEALDRLKAGGGTNGGAGIDLAYKTAMANFIQDGVNRVILCTDGDFNIGTTQTGDLVKMIEERAEKGVFLSVLGFGMGNYKDGQLEQLADKGNGNYGYIDTFSEARKILVEQLTGTLITIAKDVKIQVEFNPLQVAEYRLVGYENRMLNKEDFNDDTKDAGEIGAGHTVTALYELVPAGQKVSESPGVDPLKYQQLVHEAVLRQPSAEVLTVKLRYKQPDGDTSTKVEFVLDETDQHWNQADPDFQFVSAVAGFGMLLRDSEHKGGTTFDLILELAQSGQGEDRFGYRRAFQELVRNARALMPRQ